jgi:hypothetical protein
MKQAVLPFYLFQLYFAVSGTVKIPLFYESSMYLMMTHKKSASNEEALLQIV